MRGDPDQVGEVRVFPLVRLDPLDHWRGTRVVVAGDHVITERGWGIVVKIDEKHGSMYVRLACLGPWIPPQEFPEYDLMKRADEKQYSKFPKVLGNRA